MPLDPPQPPEGAWLQLDRDEGGRPRLSWNEPFTWGGFLFSAALALGFAALMILLMRPLIEAGPRFALKVLADGLPDNLFLAVLMMGCLVVVAVCDIALILTPCWVVYAVLRQPKPSRLTFGESEMDYECEGSSRLRRRRRKLPRSQLGEVRIDVVEDTPGLPERERLTVDHGAERVEIGEELRPWERAWLAEVIREWIGERETPEPSAFPKPPANSTITVERGEEGQLVLRWKPEFPESTHPAATGRWMRLLGMSAWLFGWTAGEVVVTSCVVAILMGRWAGWGGLECFMLAVMLVWLPGWTWGGVAVIRQWWALLRGPAVQKLELTPTSLHYRPGRIFDAQSGTFRTQPPRDVPLSEVGRISVGQTDRRQRLTIDHGAERVEIGENLREREREWLARILREWAGQELPRRP